MGHNMLDFPDSGRTVVNTDKACPTCASRNRTVQISNLNGRAQDRVWVECYTCRTAFRWTRGESPQIPPQAA